jgi:hypothetical protein
VRARRLGRSSVVQLLVGLALTACRGRPDSVSAQTERSAAEAFEANQQIAAELALADQAYVPIRLPIGGAEPGLPVLVCNPQVTDDQFGRLNRSADDALVALKAAYFARPIELAVAAQYIVSAVKYPTKDLHAALRRAANESAEVSRRYRRAVAHSTYDGPVLESLRPTAVDAAQREQIYAQAIAAVEGLMEQGADEIVLAGYGLQVVENVWLPVLKDLPPDVALATPVAETANWPVLAASFTTYAAANPEADAAAAKWLLTAYFRGEWSYTPWRAGLVVAGVVSLVEGLLPPATRPLVRQAAIDANAQPVVAPVSWEALGLGEAPPAPPARDRLAWLSWATSGPTAADPTDAPGWEAYRSNHQLAGTLGLKPEDFARVVSRAGVVLCAPYMGSDETAADISATAGQAYESLSQQDEWTGLAAGQYLFTVETWDPVLVHELCCPPPVEPDYVEETLRVCRVERDAKGEPVVVYRPFFGQPTEREVRVGDSFRKWRAESITDTEMELSKQAGEQTLRKIIHLQVGEGPGDVGPEEQGAQAAPGRFTRYLGAEGLADLAARRFALGEDRMRILAIGAMEVAAFPGPGASGPDASETTRLSQAVAAGPVGCRAALHRKCAAGLDPFAESPRSLRWVTEQVLTSARFFETRNVILDGQWVVSDPVAATKRFSRGVCDDAVRPVIGLWVNEAPAAPASFPPTPDQLGQRPH